MENKPVTTHVTKGIVIALILIVIDLVAMFTNIKLESWYGWVSMLLMLGAFIWACISYANQMNNAVTFGNVFAHGFKTSAVVACFFFIYTLLVIYVISPEFIDKVVEKQIADGQKSGKFDSLTDEQIEQAKQMGLKFGKIGAIAGAILGTIIIGAIGSLLGAAFAKKNPPTPFSNSNV